MNHMEKKTKRIITGTVVGCASAALALFGAFQFSNQDQEEDTVAVTIQSEDTTQQAETAGASTTATLQSAAKTQEAETETDASAAVETAEVPEEEIAGEVVVEEQPASEWDTMLLANVETSMNVRQEPNTDSEVVGLLRTGDAAQIVEKGDEWSYVTSGNVTGYVLNEYCLFGEDAKNYAYENCEMQATVNEDCVRLREEPSTESDVVELLAVDEELPVDQTVETEDNWVPVVYDDEVSYLSSDYVTVEPVLTEGVTIEEVEAQLQAQKEAEEAEKKAQEEAYLEAIGATSDSDTSTSGSTSSSISSTSSSTASTSGTSSSSVSSATSGSTSGSSATSSTSTSTASTTTTQNASYSASTDDTTLLAALIYCEAGGECYDGQVAVGAVVMNRVRSGSFPNSISEVIYQSGQFYPAGSSTLNNAINNGNYTRCLSAAQAALAGTDPTGGLLYFHAGTSGGTLTIGNQTFY